MAREFSSFQAFAEFMQTRIAVAEHHKHLGFDAGANMMAKAARDMVGTENDRWPSLADATIVAKQAAGHTGRISATDPLYATGKLRDSWHYSVGNAGFVWGSTDPVMAYHEHGTNKMPPRPVVGPVMFLHGKEAVSIAANWIMGAVAGKSGPMHPDPHAEAAQEFRTAAE
ncbi:MAG: hypothetical protein ACRYHQ_20095 [Janthinobacterium lividum]